MDLTEYLPFYWTVIANRWTSSSSRIFLHQFGIGVVEWRTLATLAARDAATALDASKLTGMDVAAASRAVRALYAKLLVEPVAGRFPGRNRPFRMTKSGEALFAEIRDLARQRAGLLLQDLSSDEQKLLLELLKRVHARLPVLGEHL